MEQVTFDQLDYKYIIDTCAILTQKPNEAHKRSVYKKLWSNIDNLIENNVMVICSEIDDELQDEEIVTIMNKLNCTVIEIDDTIQQNVIKIVTENPKMLSFGNKKGSSSGDAFLIATAMAYNLTVVTEENKDSPNKVPKICEKYNVKCVDINGLCELENWTF